MFTKKNNNPFNYFAHDLNNIFTQNLLTISLLKNGITDKSLIRLTEKLEDTIRIARDIINDAVDSAKESNHDIEKIHLGDVIKNVISLFEQQHSDKIILSFTSGKDIEPVAGRMLDFFRIIFNIIDNSIKAVRENGIITVSINNITDCNRKFVELLISDNGPGLSAEQIDRIVSNPPSSNEIEGISGLGLRIIQTLIKKYNGIIEVESGAQTGTLLRIRFPLHRVVNRCTNNTGKIILIGDDEEALCELLADLLNASGYNVVYANNGEALLDAAENFIVDLAVIDKNMPIMDGIKTIAEFNSRKYQFPVILATGSSETDDELAKNLSLKKIISKPFVFDELLSEIKLNLV